MKYKEFKPGDKVFLYKSWLSSVVKPNQIATIKNIGTGHIAVIFPELKILGNSISNHLHTFDKPSFKKYFKLINNCRCGSYKRIGKKHHSWCVDFKNGAL